MSIVGLMYTDRELIGFGDRKSTVTINGQDREEPGYCGVKKVFVGENFIVVAYNSNVIVRGMEIKRVSDVLERYTHVSSVDQYIGNVYRAFQEWCVGGTISLIIGDNKRVPYIRRYRVRCVDITNGSMMETVYYKNCCEGVYGGATDFRKMLDQHDEVFKQGDEIGLRNLIVRKVEDDERAGNYCPVGKEIDFKRISLMDE